MAFTLAAGVAIEESIDASSTKGSSCNSLTFLASPAAGFVATAHSFDDASNDSGFGGLLPFLAILSAMAAEAAIIIRVGITIASAATRLRTAADLVGDGRCNTT